MAQFNINGNPTAVTQAEFWSNILKDIGAVSPDVSSGLNSILGDLDLKLYGKSKGIYGDMSDGTVTFDGTTTVLGLAPSSSIYTLTRDLYLLNCTVNTGVTIVTAGFRIFVGGLLTLTGTASINWNGKAGAAGAAGGAAGAALTAGILGGATAGGAGSATNGANGASGPTSSYGGAGGAAGAGSGGTAGTGATVTAMTAAHGSIRQLPQAATGTAQAGTTFTQATGGAGGGGGGGDTTHFGGGGGGGGGVVAVIAFKITGTGSITATGGAGGAGDPAASTGAGGGGGGGGGLVIVISAIVHDVAVTGTSTATLAGTPTASAAGGAGGALAGTGAAGTAGSAGTVLLIPA